MRFILLNLTLLIPYFSVLAATEDYEFRLDSEGGSLEHVRSIDAGGVGGICSATTARTMIDAWRFTHGDQDYEFQTSPAATGFQACSKTIAWRQSQVEVGTREPYDIVSGVDGCEAADSALEFGKVYRYDPSKTIQVSERQGPAEVPWIVSKLGADLVESWEAFFDIEFESKVLEFEIPKCKKYRYGTDRAYKRALLYMISSIRAQPVGIGICDKFLYKLVDGQAKIFVQKRVARDGDWVSYVERDCTPHSSLVIGDRLIDGKRQVLLQEPRVWPEENCRAMRKIMNCTDDPRKIWVDLDPLISNITSLWRLERAGSFRTSEAEVK